MHGRQDNEVGVDYARCCGKIVAQCDCAWQARKKVLRQQVMGGNNGPVQARKAPQPTSRRANGPTTNGRGAAGRRGLASVVANIFCKTGRGGGVDPTCKVGAGGTSNSGGNVASASARSHTDAELHRAALKAGKAMFGGGSGSGFVPHDPKQGVEHTTLSALQKQQDGEHQYVDEFEYVFYPSQPGKGKDVSSAEWRHAEKGWADKDGKIYTATASGGIRVVTVDKPLPEKADKKKPGAGKAPQRQVGEKVKYTNFAGTKEYTIGAVRQEVSGKYNYRLDLPDGTFTWGFEDRLS